MSELTRRDFVKLSGSAALVGLAACAGGSAMAGSKNRVVVIGGGYGGATAAKYIRMTDASVQVTLIEQNKLYFSAPMSNGVIVGLHDQKGQNLSYEGLRRYGVNLVHDQVNQIDPISRMVATVGGKKFSYDRLIVAPGIHFRKLEGYDDAAQQRMPHAYQAGPQTLVLRDQLRAMRDGDPFILVAPPNPSRCPPGPYERASLVAHYLKKHKPKSKVLILDTKDMFPQFDLFIAGWKQLYGYDTHNSLIEWVPAGEGGRVTRVDAKIMAVYTDMDEFRSSCINVIPEQQAGTIASLVGLTDASGWCPVNLDTFESKIHKDIHVIGDACVAEDLPKSGYAANCAAKVCAVAVVTLLNDDKPKSPSYLNTCYSMISPNYSFSTTSVYKLGLGKIETVTTANSPVDAANFVREQETLYYKSWYRNIVADTFS